LTNWNRLRTDRGNRRHAFEIGTMTELNALASQMNAPIMRTGCGRLGVVGRRGRVVADGQGFRVELALPTPETAARCRFDLRSFAALIHAAGTDLVFSMPDAPDPDAAERLAFWLLVPRMRKPSAPVEQRV
jgi:hypothetical protein